MRGRAIVAVGVVVAAVAALAAVALIKQRKPSILAVALVNPSLTKSPLVERELAAPFEAALRTRAEVERFETISSSHGVQARIELEPGVDADAAWVKISATPLDAFPPGTELQRVPAQKPSIRWVVSGDSLSVLDLRDVAESIATRIERQPGVLAVHVCGGRKRQLEVRVDPPRIQARGLSLLDVLKALDGQTPGTLSTDKLAELVIAERNGTPVALRDVASVRQGAAPPDCTMLRATPRGSTPVVFIDASLRPGAKPPDDALLMRDLPSSATLTPLKDVQPFARLTAQGSDPAARWRQASDALDAARSALPDAPLFAELNDRGDIVLYTGAALRDPAPKIGDLVYLPLRSPHRRAVRILGPDLDELRQTAKDIRAPMRSFSLPPQDDELSLDFQIDRDRLARFGIARADVEQAIEASTGGIPAGVTRDGTPIMLQLGADITGDALENVRVHDVPLPQLLSITRAATPRLIRRAQGERFVEIELAGPADDVRQAIEANVKLPPGVRLEWRDVEAGSP